MNSGSWSVTPMKAPPVPESIRSQAGACHDGLQMDLGSEPQDSATATSFSLSALAVALTRRFATGPIGWVDWNLLKRVSREAVPSTWSRGR